MLSEDEKEAIKLLEDIKNNSWTTKYIMSSDSKNADILLNLITKQQKENEEKDKQIDLMARAFKQDDVRTVEEIKQHFADLLEKE